jgi:hypothetical protein
MNTKIPWCTIIINPDFKVKIDREDLELVNTHTWRVMAGSSGKNRVVTSIRTSIGVRTLSLGSFLMKPPKGKQVYPRRHLEGLDYRKSNLIICTIKERQRMLPKKRKGTSSIYRGVSFSSLVGKWRAGVEVNGKSINLGNFATEIEAAVAYNSAARKYFGINAYQNPIKKKQSRE